MASFTRAALNRWLDSRQAKRVLRWVQVAFAVAGVFAVVGIIDDYHPLGLPDWFWLLAQGYCQAFALLFGGGVVVAASAFFLWAAASVWKGAGEMTRPLDEPREKNE